MGLDDAEDGAGQRNRKNKCNRNLFEKTEKTFVEISREESVKF